MTTTTRFRLFLGCGVILIGLAGCQFFGPTSIQVGRPVYNDVIQETSKLQTFANIIRVAKHEPTSFMEVSQINAQFAVQGSLMGAVAGIGGTRIGSANLGLLFQENPNITYTPLTGQSLVSQIATPITVDSLANLINSDWSITSVLSLAVDRLTPGYEDYGMAINALIALDDLGAITISVTKIETSPPKTTKPIKENGSSASAEPSTVLEITLQTSHPNTRRNPEQAPTLTEIRDLWCRLVAVMTHTKCPTSVEKLSLAVSVSPSRNILYSNVAINQIKTRSAIGILKAATEIPEPLVAIVPPETYEVITNRPWNRTKARLSTCANASYYTLLPKDEGEFDNPTKNSKYDEMITSRVVDKISRFDQSPSVIESCLYTIDYSLNPTNYENSLLENRLRNLRRFVLVIESDHEIPGSYVSYPYRGKWYSIDLEDEISQKNFVLIGQFLTMQSTVTTTPPPAPTVSVGGSP